VGHPVYIFIFISVFTAQLLCLSVVQILIHGFRGVELIILAPKNNVLQMTLALGFY